MIRNLFLLLTLISCASVQTPAPVEVRPAPTIELPKPVKVLPVKHIAIKVESLSGFNPTQLERFKKILSITEKVINSPEFKKAVESHTFKGKLGYHDTTDTPAEVFTKITSKDWLLDYRLEYLRPFSKVVGYTYPNVDWIVINARKYPVLTDAEISANVCHERMHKIGYEHSYKHNQDRPYSVPYALGSICEDLYGTMERIR